MAISFLPVSDHRFKKSPFFACNDKPETRYGIYNQRLYPLSSNYDDVAHYQHLKTDCCLYDVPETPLRIIGNDAAAFLQKLFTRNVKKTFSDFNVLLININTGDNSTRKKQPN